MRGLLAVALLSFGTSAGLAQQADPIEDQIQGVMDRMLEERRRERLPALMPEVEDVIDRSFEAAEPLLVCSQTMGEEVSEITLRGWTDNVLFAAETLQRHGVAEDFVSDFKSRAMLVGKAKEELAFSEVVAFCLDHPDWLDRLQFARFPDMEREFSEILQ